jgi:nitroreductase
MLKDLIVKNRSYRRFHQDFKIEKETLRELIDLARLSASAKNLQPLKYILSCDPEKNDLIFQQLAWAGYLEDWQRPAEGEKPSAYIIVLGDTRISNEFKTDFGIAAQNILLGATEKGLGGCIIGSVVKTALRQGFDIALRYEIINVIALGKPKETVVVEDIEPGKDIKYYRDSENVHHVPKRGLDEIIIA